MTWEVRVGDALTVLRTMEPESVQCVVTSPPYWGLRDYGTAAWEGGDADCDHKGQIRMSDKTNIGRSKGHDRRLLPDAPSRHVYAPFKRICGKCGAVRQDQQLGLEPTPNSYVEHMVEVFREVRRVLRKDGTVWLNLGDSYGGGTGGDTRSGFNARYFGKEFASDKQGETAQHWPSPRRGLKPKDLVGIPWRLAFALQADGWWLRSDIIWAKPNPMPESVTDRPTKAHEYVFLLTKSARYFYDADGVREPMPAESLARYQYAKQDTSPGRLQPNGVDRRTTHVYNPPAAGRNLRTVWTIATEAFPDAHFATFPKALVEPCIKAGTSEKGCCSECGAPWKRVIERTGAVNNRDRVDVGDWIRDKGGNADGKRSLSGATYQRVSLPTTGWRPTCGHGPYGGPDPWPRDADPIPCVVLDPFAGSGTVGVVACQYGRSFIGIELNPVYAEMAERRITNEAGLFSVAP